MKQAEHQVSNYSVPPLRKVMHVAVEYASDVDKHPLSLDAFDEKRSSSKATASSFYMKLKNTNKKDTLSWPSMPKRTKDLMLLYQACPI